ncbi:alkaline phosphatase [Bacteroidota bacterium]
MIRKTLRITVITVLTGFIILFASCTSTQPSTPHAKNIIFLIGDGMGLNQLVAAHTVKKGNLAITSVSHIGLQTNQSANNYITDSAASGTALACGKKTNNGAIGVDAEQNELVSILKIAEANNKSTGLVSTSAITHATPAAFIANEESRNNYEAIAADFLKTDIDVFIGGGMNHFASRADGRDLTEELRSNGYAVYSQMADLDAHTSGNVAALLAPMHIPRILDGRGDMLPKATKKAIELLNQNENGFFVMIEGSQIDWGGHANDEEYVISETIDFDEAVRVALDFAKKDGETLVVVTADHETGGMHILKGNMEAGTVESVFATGGHTGVMIPVYAYGPGAEYFTGFFDNTEFKSKFLAISEMKEE